MSLRRSLIWAYSGQFISFVATFIGSVIVARLLTPHELGIFAIAVASSGVIAVFTTFGVSSYVVREGVLEQRILDTAFTINALLAMTLSGLVLVASFAGQWLFDEPGVGRVLRITGLLPLLGIFSFRAGVMFQREMRYGITSTISMATGIIATASTATAAWLGASYMSPAYGGLIGSVIATLATAWIGRVHWSLRCSLTEWRPISAFGLRLISISGISQLNGRMCDIVLGKSQNLTALGLYGRASGLSNMIWSNIYGSATQVIFSQLSKDLRETGELRRTYVRSLQNILALLWPVLIGLAVLSQPVVMIIYGERWLPAALPLSLLMVMQAFVLVYGMNWELFVLRNRMAEQTRLELIRSLIGFTTFAIGAQFSLVGAAAGRVFDAFIGIWLYVPYVRSLADTRRGELRRVYLESGLLTLGAVGPSAMLMALSAAPESVGLLAIAVAILAGGAIWLALLVWLKHPLLDEMKLVYARFGGRRRSVA